MSLNFVIKNHHSIDKGAEINENLGPEQCLIIDLIILSLEMMNITAKYSMY